MANIGAFLATPTIGTTRMDIPLFAGVHIKLSLLCVFTIAVRLCPIF